MSDDHSRRVVMSLGWIHDDRAKGLNRGRHVGELRGASWNIAGTKARVVTQTGYDLEDSMPDE